MPPRRQQRPLAPAGADAGNAAGIAQFPLRRSVRSAAVASSLRIADIYAAQHRLRPLFPPQLAVDENLSDDEVQAPIAPGLPVLAPAAPGPLAVAPAHAQPVAPIAVGLPPGVAQSGTLNQPGVGLGGPGFFDETKNGHPLRRVLDPNDPPHQWIGTVKITSSLDHCEIKVHWSKTRHLGRHGQLEMRDRASRHVVNMPDPFGGVADYTVQFANTIQQTVLTKWQQWNHMKVQIYAEVEQGDPGDAGDWSRPTRMKAFDTYHPMPGSYNNLVHQPVPNRPNVSMAQQYAGLVARDGFDTDDDVVSSYLSALQQRIEGAMGGQLNEGDSAYMIKAINSVEIRLVRYVPGQGGAFLALPVEIANKKACINPKNSDEACFKHAVRAFWYADQLEANGRHVHAERISNYRDFPEEDIDFSMITDPMGIDVARLERFEKSNQVCLNIWSYTESKLKSRAYDYYKLYATRSTFPKVCNLIYIANEDHTRFHYAWVKNFSRLLNSDNDHHYWCHRCQNKYTQKARYEQHMATNECYLDGERAVQVILPEAQEAVLTYTPHKAEQKVPYVIIADFECFCQPIVEREVSGSNGRLLEHKLPENFHTEHVPNSFSYQVIDDSLAVQPPPVIFTGPNPSVEFVRQIMEFTSEKRQLWLDEHEGKDQGFQVVVGFHNGKRYDFHPVMDGISQIIEIAMDENRAESLGMSREEYLLGRLASAEPEPELESPSLRELCQARGWCMRTLTNKLRLPSLSVTPKTTEDYLAIRFGNITFMDTMNLQAASLDSLVSKLEAHDFRLTDRYFAEFGPEVCLRMHRKGVYPYEHMQDWANMAETSLPPIEDFFSSLSQSGIKPADYEFAQWVWATFHCRTMRDYHDIYNTHDTLLQSDVFIRHREICMQHFELDPFWFMSTPGYAFQSMLKKTGVTMELFSEGNIDQVIFTERLIRGGISMIGEMRYAASNSTLLTNHVAPEVASRYDGKMPETSIQYYDMKNLYGWCMSQHLPQGGYAWNHDLWTPAKIAALGLEDPVGYFFEVDLECPDELHDWFLSLPPAPIRRAVAAEELSPIQEWLSPNYQGSAKLICDLHPKQKYLIHYRTLQVYLRMGVQVTGIHRVLQFRQSAWLRPYVELCRDLREKATTSFEKDFWKLMVNAVYGKMMENVRKYLRFELAACSQSFQRYTSHPDFEGFVVFRKDSLMGVRIRKTKITMDKPIAVGAAILDIAKAHMYSFWYEQLKPRFDPRITPPNWPYKLKLLMMDTDSFCFQIEGPPVPSGLVTDSGLMLRWMDLHSVLDCSTYPAQHFLYHNRFKSLIGVMKDECCGSLVLEFVGLRAKMYAYSHVPYLELPKQPIETIVEKKVAKGIPRFIIKNQMTLQLYKDILGHPRQIHRTEFDQFRSLNHRIYTCRIKKIGLRAFDDKRYLVDGIYSYPHGHYLIEAFFQGSEEVDPETMYEQTVKVVKLN